MCHHCVPLLRMGPCVLHAACCMGMRHDVGMMHACWHHPKRGQVFNLPAQSASVAWDLLHHHMSAGRKQEVPPAWCQESLRSAWHGRTAAWNHVSMQAMANTAAVIVDLDQTKICAGRNEPDDTTYDGRDAPLRSDPTQRWTARWLRRPSCHRSSQPTHQAGRHEPSGGPDGLTMN